MSSKRELEKKRFPNPGVHHIIEIAGEHTNVEALEDRF
jgi:hypothetical protein